MRTYVAILEYCGGVSTDRLCKQMARWNPGRDICVLDNASPWNRCHSVNVQNHTNTFIGGGINDCIKLAEQNGATYLFLLMNDVKPLTILDVSSFEAVMDSHPNAVQVAPAVAAPPTYPWMMWHQGGALREAPHSDIFCAAIRLDFIRSFGGFPVSKGAWGYDWELAYQARQQGKSILISDCHVVVHTIRIRSDAGTQVKKRAEMVASYSQRYRDFDRTIQLIKDEYASQNRLESLRDRSSLHA